MKLNIKSLEAVFEPAANPGSDASDPLLIVMHGRGDSPAGFFWLPEALHIPTLNYLFLQAPDDYYGGYSWYDMPPNQGPGITRSRKLLEQVFSELEAQSVNLKEVFLMGFSQGCLMTLEFGARFEPVLAGYVGISGYAYDVQAILKETKPELKTANWYVTHGTLDEVLEVERTRLQIKELNANGFKIKYTEYPKAHTIDDRKELPELRAWILTRIENF